VKKALHFHEVSHHSRMTDMSDQSGATAAQRIQVLSAKAKTGDSIALAQLLTLLEREGVEALSWLPELLTPEKPAFRIGITGPPGAGKSTLIGQLIRTFRAQGKRIGIMAVDPSSPFSKGAVLGDRIRYNEHFNDPGVFIRSLGSRGSLGGLSSSAYLMVRAFDLAKYDIVLLETVGVGQTELDIMNVADWVSVVLVPESGDGIQGMKAGLLEIADLFIVNKSDRPGADTFARELEMAMHLDPRAPSEPVQILKTTATTGGGVDVLVDLLTKKAGGSDWQSRRDAPERLRSEAKALLRAAFDRELDRRLEGLTQVSDLAGLGARVKL
jgi:LAO/AO transport system kinase